MKYPEDSFDIEELHVIAKKLKCCPHYHNRLQVKDVDMILMPYNYLMDTQIRKNMGIQLENAIIIVDEAHNIA